MTQIALPFLFIRGGTSRGPYLQAKDLPSDRGAMSRVLVAALGSGHPLNIDGIGGGNAVTTKVAILSPSKDDWADVDYFFAQVSVGDGKVDYKPTCGNILSGVGPAAIEMGLIPVVGNTATVNIRAVNTGARVVATVQIEDGKVRYDGDAQIDGVPGTAAPVSLQFMDTVGGATGAFLPTGNLIDIFDGINVTCMDVAMPMVIARAAEFGLTGYETADELNENRDFFARMEAIRIKAGAAMGIKDVPTSVTPKFGLLAPAVQGGTIATRYFMPWVAHPSMAVTGAQCLASCVLTPGSVADGMTTLPTTSPATITLEHASGSIDVLVDYAVDAGEITLKSAGLVRTARLLARGELMISKRVLDGL
ncbi:4-oxalomesaconate tautomerase [Sulfitobacter sp. SK012]|uniref:4-oxalomesaconate tautomerase n=1 Tax=Sulfitobacter sp. SK012 TaxID=1389005 RepID=UPI000E0A52C5|nr:4-oxalomesaconate tautomerase [Sulfitobacter sp. SK012]AXI48680.1 4-oxalomesaconate tautomerase [Sulfitobacter sp. SK012]